MTLEERLARLEQRADDRDAVLIRIEGKVDALVEAAHMGKGAWWLILRLGAVLTAIVAAGAWLFDRLHK